MSCDCDFLMTSAHIVHWLCVRAAKPIRAGQYHSNIAQTGIRGGGGGIINSDKM